MLVRPSADSELVRTDTSTSPYSFPTFLAQLAVFAAVPCNFLHTIVESIFRIDPYGEVAAVRVRATCSTHHVCTRLETIPWKEMEGKGVWLICRGGVCPNPPLVPPTITQVSECVGEKLLAVCLHNTITHSSGTVAKISALEEGDNGLIAGVLSGENCLELLPESFYQLVQDLLVPSSIRTMANLALKVLGCQVVAVLDVQDPANVVVESLRP